MSPGLGQNLPRAKQMNRSLILEQILFYGPMTRQQIAQNLGLTSATITNFVAKMIREGLLAEVGYVEEVRLGRKSIAIDFRSNCYAVIAIHLRASDMEIGFVDLRGRVSNRRLIRYPTPMPKESFLRFVREQIEIQQGERKELRVVAVSIGVRGMQLGGDEGGANSIIISDYMDTARLREDVSTYVDAPVMLGNHTSGMALAEKMYGQGRPLDDFLLIYMGPKGIGSGLVFNGEPYRGHGSTAIGLGHMMFSDDGPKCSCGRTGCLEMYASEAAILAECGIDDVHELIRRLGQADARATQAVEEAGRKIAAIINSFLSIVQLQRIVLGGTLASESSVLVSAIEENMRQKPLMFEQFTTEVSVSALGHDLGIIGAAAPAILECVIRGDEFPENIE